jgi:hypothetical protein
MTSYSNALDGIIAMLANNAQKLVGQKLDQAAEKRGIHVSVNRTPHKAENQLTESSRHWIL